MWKFQPLILDVNIKKIKITIACLEKVCGSN